MTKCDKYPTFELHHFLKLAPAISKEPWLIYVNVSPASVETSEFDVQVVSCH